MNKGHWWRAHDDSVDHPKLQRLAPALFKHWYNLLCLASANGGVLPPIEEVAFKLRISSRGASDTIETLIERRLLDRGEDGTVRPHNWDARQFKSDTTDPTNAERQRRYREGHKAPLRNGVSNGQNNDGENVTAKRPDYRLQTTETERNSPLRGEARKRATRLSNDWVPTQENLDYALAKGLSADRSALEAEKFRNFWTAKSGKDATKHDWEKTWHNWILRSLEMNGHAANQKQTLSERAHELAEQARKLELAAGIGIPDDALGSD